ncbi:MAG: hypothetical protein [Caudoviricetes sp.]|nr:MAG: hypothetical protein [Caudoviricetes sp.]
MYFTYSSDHGFDEYKTEEEAKQAAEGMIQDFLVDGWSEEVTSVCWGKIEQHAVMANKRKAPKSSEFSYICDYVLK